MITFTSLVLAAFLGGIVALIGAVALLVLLLLAANEDKTVRSIHLGKLLVDDSVKTVRHWRRSIFSGGLTNVQKNTIYARRKLRLTKLV